MPLKQIASQASGHVNALSAGGAAATAWLANIELIFRIGASGVAMVSGIYAVLWYRQRIKESRNGSSK